MLRRDYEAEEMTTLPLKGFKIEGGKVKPIKKRKSVSERRSLNGSDQLKRWAIDD